MYYDHFGLRVVMSSQGSHRRGIDVHHLSSRRRGGRSSWEGTGRQRTRRWGDEGGAPGTK